MKNQQCDTCVSRRLIGNINEGGCLKCSLGASDHLGENEKCGSYVGSGIEKDDYKFEYGYMPVDEVTERWLDGEEV